MKLYLRKIRDRLGWIRNWIVPRIQDFLGLKKTLSQALRRRPFLRRALHLPSPPTISVQEWMERDHGADEYLVLDPGQDVVRKIPTTNQPANNWFYETQKATQIDPTSILKLEGGFVHGHAGAQLLNGKGNYLWDASTEDWLYFKTGFFMDSALRLPSPTRLAGTATVLAHRSARNNFSHWVFDVLPRIGLLERTVGLESIDHFLVGHSDRGYEWETLRELGVPRDKVVQLLPNSYFQAQKVVFPSHSRYHNASHQHSSLEYLKRSFLTAPPAGKKRRLFISRADASFRRLKEEGRTLPPA